MGKYAVECTDYEGNEEGTRFTLGLYDTVGEALQACGDYIRYDLENRRAIVVKK